MHSASELDGGNSYGATQVGAVQSLDCKCLLPCRLYRGLGRGIQKICDSCRELGTPDPEYIVFGNDITVKFTALKPAKASDEALNRHDDGLDVGLAEKTLKIISENPKATMAEIANECNVTKRTVERTIKALREQGKIVREGGKRYGHWKVL